MFLKSTLYNGYDLYAYKWKIVKFLIKIGACDYQSISTAEASAESVQRLASVAPSIVVWRPLEYEIRTRGTNLALGTCGVNFPTGASG